MGRMPKWADAVLVPLLSLIIAFVISGLVILAIGEDPVEALKIMVTGALGSTYGWGYTLYYATNFIFTGLAVAIAFHAGLFNIGGEGQATLGGLGVAVACLMLPWPHWSLALLASVVLSAAFGAAWAAAPAWLQAKRGSHIVITTIMFNFIAAALLNYLLVNVMRPRGQMDPASARFPAETNLPDLHQMLGWFGIPFAKGTPANVSLFVALIACVAVWAIIWRTRLGYEIRSFGKSEKAAIYAGISPVRITMYAMLISGALSGLMAVNTVQGEANRLLLNSVEGAGFIGIAVALMGRSHPVGVFFAALLFGFLYQGGAELALWTKIPRELITVIQALVILFTGALDDMVRVPLKRLFLASGRGGQ
ncbi:nucleoside ABC transporter membrane protein [Gemmobacter caeni]|jgi:simple sugar transport system permease protein|uniref:Nucleoside ABC transporter membrane protein n=1 Tax=Gemmobacter caeni TaxID=589035 RepID=A0A2T6AYN1_9RHOB|nr:ABC transporter permease [Gemmobacter caeni]PTX48916.1 nucleoside ABC transporter membrane protein [Gemmobacter caeni]TWI99083.1 nucleoside ABC transporter membrane protein [Gemmobacter caeni]